MGHLLRGPRDKHPSGRPIPQSNKRGYSDGYRNQDGPRTLRLRNTARTNAIGFLASLTTEPGPDPQQDS